MGHVRSITDNTYIKRTTAFEREKITIFYFLLFFPYLLKNKSKHLLLKITMIANEFFWYKSIFHFYLNKHFLTSILGFYK